MQRIIILAALSLASSVPALADDQSTREYQATDLENSAMYWRISGWTGIFGAAAGVTWLGLTASACSDLSSLGYSCGAGTYAWPVLWTGFDLAWTVFSFGQAKKLDAKADAIRRGEYSSGALLTIPLDSPAYLNMPAVAMTPNGMAYMEVFHAQW